MDHGVTLTRLVRVNPQWIMGLPYPLLCRLLTEKGEGAACEDWVRVSPHQAGRSTLGITNVDRRLVATHRLLLVQATQREEGDGPACEEG